MEVCHQFKPQISGKKILAVDDSLVNLHLISAILEREGFDLITTCNSVETLPLVIKHRPDLILLDVMMPELSGMDLIHILKSNSEVCHIPILMVTACSRSEDVRDALENGAFDYIKKPLNEIEIVARVRSALRYKANQDRLLELAMRDSLTGLYNHALLIDLLDKALYMQNRGGPRLAFCMLDIDFFKKINDNYGHLAGDHILRETSHILSQTLRKGDPIGRYGGEEFGLILPGVSPEQARILCERIRHNVEHHQFIFENQIIPVTLSAGLAMSTLLKVQSATDLIRMADEALYRAKDTGRNRLVIAPQEESEQPAAAELTGY